MSLTETVYFIAGGSRGIGLEFVQQLVKRQDSIVYAGVRTPTALAKLFDPLPQNLIILKCDVTSDDDVAICAAVIAKGVHRRVDVLIHNAGIDNFLPIRNTTPEQLRWVLETNLVAPLRVLHAFVPLMSTSPVKKVICISSDFGSITMNDRKEYGAYNVSKAGLNMLVTQFKNEYADDGITFIPMHPGYVLTCIYIELMVGHYGYDSG
jgi:NAD(P)-dependent dehydrogenase (short-subunit alcohol dehydrogenase family)